MLDLGRPSSVRADQLGWSLPQSSLKETANGCWPVDPSATMQHSGTAVGASVCVWAAHGTRPAKSHKNVRHV